MAPPPFKTPRPSTPGSSAEASRSATRDALLDAAETLFAEHGIGAASLRAITRAAGANLAAVHYHFGSKEGLVRAVFARRLEPLQRERLRRLESALEEARAAGVPPSVEAVLEAFIAPVVEMRWADEENLNAFARLMTRAAIEVGTGRPVFAEHVEGMGRRFLAALGEAVPGLPRDELLWRFQFAVGAFIHTVGPAPLLRTMARRQPGREASEDAALGRASDPAESEPSWDPARQGTDAATTVARLVTFLAPGFRAALRPADGATDRP